MLCCKVSCLVQSADAWTDNRTWSCALHIQENNTPVKQVKCFWHRPIRQRTLPIWFTGVLYSCMAPSMSLSRLGVLGLSHPHVKTSAAELFACGLMPCYICICDVGWEPVVVNLGHCYRKQQRWDDAVQVYERALGLCPGQAGTYAALGFTRHLKVTSHVLSEYDVDIWLASCDLCLVSELRCTSVCITADKHRIKVMLQQLNLWPEACCKVPMVTVLAVAVVCCCLEPEPTLSALPWCGAGTSFSNVLHPCSPVSKTTYCIHVHQSASEYTTMNRFLHCPGRLAASHRGLPQGTRAPA